MTHMKLHPLCESCVVWARLSLLPDVKIPAPLPENLARSAADVTFKEDTARLFRTLKTDRLGEEMQAAAFTLVQQLATWKLPQRSCAVLFRGRESKVVKTTEEFYNLCLYVLYRCHDDHCNSNKKLAPLSQDELDNLALPASPTVEGSPTSPLGNALSDRKHGKGLIPDDPLSIPMSQEQLDNYMLSCASTEIEGDSPIAGELWRRKRLAANSKGEDGGADDANSDGVLTESGGECESPMSKALQRRMNPFALNDDNENQEYEIDANTETSPVSGELLKIKKQHAKDGHVRTGSFLPDSLGADVDGGEEDGFMSPMTRALSNRLPNVTSISDFVAQQGQ